MLLCPAHLIIFGEAISEYKARLNKTIPERPNCCRQQALNPFKLDQDELPNNSTYCVKLQVPHPFTQEHIRFGILVQFLHLASQRMVSLNCLTRISFELRNAKRRKRF